MKSYTLKSMGQWSGEDLSDRGIAVGERTVLQIVTASHSLCSIRP